MYQFKFGYGENEHINENDLYKYRCIKQNIIENTKEDINYIVNSLVVYVYTVKKSSNKKLLWACFGKEIVENLKTNVTGKVCPICGRRFEYNSFVKDRQICCSKECKIKYDTQNRKHCNK